MMLPKHLFIVKLYHKILLIEVTSLSSQHRTPLFDGLKHHAAKQTVPFHIPGHKRGAGMDPEFRQFIGDNLLSIDQINIEPLDDLHHPYGIIEEAQNLAAEAFGADHTFFSVQGTSGAIMTMIMAVCGPDDKIIVPRNVHKSIMSAVVFSGAKPIFIHPELDQELGISHGISVDSVEKAIRTHEDAKALLMINPTYFGISSDLETIVDTAHQYDIPVLVDEAHGVHIHFHEDLPVSAMQAGADMSATSVHKLGGSLTQSSVLNIQGRLVSRSRVQTVMNMLTTTSTSYPLLASLDTARRYLAVNGEKALSTTIRLAENTRVRLNAIPGIHCPGNELVDGNTRFAFDPTKLLISIRDLQVGGYQIEQELRKTDNIEVELSDLYNILCILTPGDTEETVEQLVNAMERIAQKYFHPDQFVKNHVNVDVPNIPLLTLSPREAFYSETEIVPLIQAAGRISAEFIMIYPPGIPIFIPGEIIENENIEYILKNKQAGLPVQGPEDPTLENIRVIRGREAIL